MHKTITSPPRVGGPWQRKLQADKQPKRVRLDKDFAGIRAGTMLFVGTPAIVNAFVRAIPAGQTRSIERMRRELARANGCDAMCPVSTAIFLRISAQTAIEQMNAGMPVDQIAPFWRIIHADSTIGRKLTIDNDWITHQRTLETPRTKGSPD